MRWLLFLSIFLILVFISSGITGSYKESAHGNSTDGVNRSSMSGYSQGNCAHCHEMHASVEGSEPNPAGGAPSKFALFADNFNTAKTTGPYEQSDNFCFYCHGPSSLQVNGITNYDYSQTFGGAPENENATTIMDAFNQASYHNLYDIWDFANDTFSFFASDSNPCVACHNPHIAKRNKANPGDPTFTAISLPSDHGNLWGDDANETMNYYAAGYTYQAPYYNSTSSYEPAGDTIYDGSNMPDYVTFCQDCHSKDMSSYDLSHTPIDWETGDKHGKISADGSIEIKDPYSNSSMGDYVLSCTDCHEPHGSPNIYLIRREVNNGTLGDTVSAGSDFGWLCRQCHKDDWEYVHHLSSSDAPYTGKSDNGCYSQCSKCHFSGGVENCMNCHFHGGDDAWLQTTEKSFCYTGRKCF